MAPTSTAVGIQDWIIPLDWDLPQPVPPQQLGDRSASFELRAVAASQREIYARRKARKRGRLARQTPPSPPIIGPGISVLAADATGSLGRQCRVVAWLPDDASPLPAAQQHHAAQSMRKRDEILRRRMALLQRHQHPKGSPGWNAVVQGFSRRRGVKQSWSKWTAAVLLLRQKRLALDTAETLRRRTLNAAGFEAFRRCWLRVQPKQRILLALIQRALNAPLAKVLHSWRHRAQEQLTTRAATGRIVRRMLNLWLANFLDVWIGQWEERRKKIRGVLNRMLVALVSHAWNRWREYTAERRRLAELLSLWLAFEGRANQRLLDAVIVAWVGFVDAAPGRRARQRATVIGLTAVGAARLFKAQRRRRNWNQASAALLIQAGWRGWLDRRILRRRHNAAIRIQAAQVPDPSPSLLAAYPWVCWVMHVRNQQQSSSIC